MRTSSLSLLAPLLLLSTTPSTARAASGDDWLGPDKPKHFAACFVLAGVGYGAGALLFEPPEARLLTGAGLALGVGVGKELYDLGRGTTFSLKDLAWDAAGTATGLGVAWLVDRLVFGPPARAASDASLRRDVPLVVFVPGALGGGLGGGLGRQEVLVGTRARFDESQQLLALHERIHRHQGAALSRVSAGDEHGDLSSRALPQAAGGHDVDGVGEPSLAQRALEPAGQLDATGPGAAAHQALATDEHVDVLARLVRLSSAFIPHPSSSSSSGPGTSTSRHTADAPLRGR
ncbi:YfiM family protein [Corallococcus terminator]